MRNHLLTAIAFCTLSITGIGQITITNADLPDAGDSYTLTSATNFLGADIATTGTNQIWDFTNLMPGQTVLEEFVAVNATPTVYSLVFNNFLDPDHQSDFAQAVAVPDSIAGLVPSDVFNFYRLNSSEYTFTGFGGTISGIPIPIGYDPVDVIYELPLAFGNTSSDNSAFEVNLTGFGYYGTELQRQTEVDGWGSLTTSFGTFDAIRIHTTLQYHDSINTDSLPTGIGIDRPLQHEYQWLGAGHGMPLLQINTTELLGVETVTSATYQSNEPVGISSGATAAQPALFIFPNPSSERIMVLNAAGIEAITIHDLQGKMVKVHPCQNNTGTVTLTVSELPAGIYIVEAKGFKPTQIAVR